MNKRNDGPPDRRERELILSELDRTILVEAAAGTGKTTSMVGRMTALLAAGKCRAEEIAAITFTRKAAAELRTRFRIELENRLRGAVDKENLRLAAALASVDGCFISTIHSFCARLLRERPIEAGVDIDFREMEPEEDELLKARVWDEHVAWLYANERGTIDELSRLGVNVARLKDPFVRIANYPDVDEWPAEIAPKPDLEKLKDALRKCAARMREVDSRLNPAHEDRLMAKYRLIPRMVRCSDLDDMGGLGDILSEFRTFDRKDVTQKNWPGGKDEALAELEWWNAFCEATALPALEWLLTARYEACLRTLRPALERYEREKRRAGLLNYQDLLMTAAALLRDRPNAREYFRRRFKRLLVDEFQDTDPVQAEVMLLLTSDNTGESDWRKCRPAPGALFVVGDPKQSIYRFRRADITTYNAVRGIIERSGGTVLGLTTNFRAAGPLVEWVNGAFDGVFPEIADEWSPQGRPMAPGRAAAASGSLPAILQLTLPGGEKKEFMLPLEADILARHIRLSGRPGDYMIITKRKESLTTFAAKLQEHGVPHQVTGGGALNEVRALSLLRICLRAVTRPDDQAALVAALRSELFGFSDPELYSFVKRGGAFSFRKPAPDGLEEETKKKFNSAFRRLGTIAARLNRYPFIAAVELTAAELGLTALTAAGLGGNGRAGAFGKAIELLRRRNREGAWDAAAAVGFLEQIADSEVKFDGLPALPSSEPVVRVMNLHKAKGLEAPVVILADPSGARKRSADIHIDRAESRARGFMEFSYMLGEHKRVVFARPAGWEEIAEREMRFLEAEEKRLLYVAATRARDTLIVSRRDKRQGLSAWKRFDDFLDDRDDVSADEVNETKNSGSKLPDKVSADAAAEMIRGRWEVSLTPGYRLTTVTAKAEGTVAALASGGGRGEGAGPGGAEWGSLIHALLDFRMRNPDVDLRARAEAEAAEFEELRGEVVSRAIETVEKVAASEIWKRAMNAADGERFTEFPFKIMDGDELVSGQIDLVFRDAAKGGWALVDYKTGGETFGESHRRQLDLYARAWERISGEKVVEAGVFYVREGKYEMRE